LYLSCDLSCDVQVTELLGQELVVNTTGNGVGQVEVQLEYHVAESTSQQHSKFNIATNVSDFNPSFLQGDDCVR